MTRNRYAGDVPFKEGSSFAKLEYTLNLTGGRVYGIFTVSPKLECTLQNFTIFLLLFYILTTVVVQIYLYAKLIGQFVHCVCRTLAYLILIVLQLHQMLLVLLQHI